MSSLTDTHCHLYFDAFDTDRAEVIARAMANGVTKILVPAIDLQTSRAAIALAEETDGVFAAIGVHPNSASEWKADTMDELRAMARHPKVMAIGEVGMDYHWNKSPRYIQEQVFHNQLELAAELGLPVVVHNREATADVLRILAGWVERLMSAGNLLVQRPGVMHSFSGTVEEAKAAEKMGFRLGITGPVTFKNGKGMQAIAAEINLSTLLVETDAPFLTPEPLRGSRNEPQQIKYIVEKIAQLRNIPLADVMMATTNNAALLFNW